MSSCRRTRGFSPFLCAECSYSSLVPPFSSRARTSSAVRISGAILAHRAGRTAHAHARGAFLPTSYKYRRHGQCMHHARIRVSAYSHTLAVRASRRPPLVASRHASYARQSEPRRPRHAAAVDCRYRERRRPRPAPPSTSTSNRAGEAPMSVIRAPYGMDPTTSGADDRGSTEDRVQWPATPRVRKEGTQS